MKGETMQVAGCPDLHGGTANERPFLSKQLSLLENPRDRAWERRRRQILRQERRKEEIFNNNNDESDLTDEDMCELKACIELGFGFCEEEASGCERVKLSSTLPALDLYFAVNRGRGQTKGLACPLSIPMMSSSSDSSSSGSLMGSPSSSVGFSPINDSDMWKIFNPGDDPKLVKTKLRHWAQAVACSVMQSQ